MTAVVELAKTGKNGAGNRVALRHDRYGKAGHMGFLDKTNDLLAQNADKLDTAIDKAAEFVDSTTECKYADTVEKVQEAAKKAVDKD
jgi:hypothetical protein